MRSRTSDSPAQIFVCASGEALPRWREAFPRLQCVRQGDAFVLTGPNDVVWLRLTPNGQARSQVDAVFARHPDANVIVLADQPDDDEALILFSSGIRGYCNAHSTAANLRQVAQVVQAGGLWIGQSLMARLVVATGRALAATPLLDASVPDQRLSSLTQRELEVARLIANGASNKEVARGLSITERTVKAHAGSIFSKLGARDRLHLSLIVNGRERKVEKPPAEAKAPVRSSISRKAEVAPMAGRERAEKERWKG